MSQSDRPDIQGSAAPSPSEQAAATPAPAPAGAPKPAPDKLPAGGEAPRTGKVAEIGGPSGPEPTRYGDWERNGRVSDF